MVREYIVVNNSGKIEVCNPTNLLRVATITGFTSPRFIVPVSASKAYVSDYISNSISIVNLVNNTVQVHFLSQEHLKRWYLLVMMFLFQASIGIKCM